MKESSALTALFTPTILLYYQMQWNGMQIILLPLRWAAGLLCFCQGRGVIFGNLSEFVILTAFW